MLVVGDAMMPPNLEHGNRGGKQALSHAADLLMHEEGDGEVPMDLHYTEKGQEKM